MVIVVKVRGFKGHKATVKLGDSAEDLGDHFPGSNFVGHISCSTTTTRKQKYWCL